MSLAHDIDETVDASGGPSLLRAAPDTVSFKKLRKRLVRQVRQALDQRAGAPADGQPDAGGAAQS